MRSFVRSFVRACVRACVRGKYLGELPVPTRVALAVTLFVDKSTGTGDSRHG